MQQTFARSRRMRRTEALRSLVRETHLRPSALIAPMFLVPGEGIRKPISSMPGVFNLSIDEALKDAAACAGLGIGGLLLFGLPREKTSRAAARGMSKASSRPRCERSRPIASWTRWPSSPTSACASTRRTATAG